MAEFQKAILQTVGATEEITVEVQFNPSELSLRHGVEQSSEKTIGGSQQIQDQAKQAVAKRETTLHLSLHFDAYLLALSLSRMNQKGRDTPNTSMASGSGDSRWEVSSDELLPAFQDGTALKQMNERIHDLIRMARIDKDLHAPPQVRFVWGSGLCFTGYIQSISTAYTMFDPSGRPTRAKVDIDIGGEETPLMQEAAQSPPQSPDRTKERLMMETDQMWMLAYNEYKDVNMWKSIARANGILNPRAVSRAVKLKLPSIR